MEDEKKVNPEPVTETNSEEKKEETVTGSEEESDFSDEAKPVSVPETPAEEKEPEVNLYAEPKEEKAETVAPVTEEQTALNEEDHEKDRKKVKGSQYVYPDPELSAIESARQNFYRVYHKFNIVIFRNRRFIQNRIRT